MVTGDLIAFALLGGITIAGAVCTVMTNKLFHSALFLAATLLGVATLFLMAGAQMLFVVQILVYVGAVVTLILFAIMFTHGSTREEETPK